MLRGQCMYRMYRLLSLFLSVFLCPSFFSQFFFSIVSEFLIPKTDFHCKLKDIVMKKNNATLTTTTKQKKNCHSNQSKSHNCMSEHEFYLHIQFFFLCFLQHRAPKRRIEWTSERVEYLFIYFNFIVVTHWTFLALVVRFPRHFLLFFCCCERVCVFV